MLWGWSIHTIGLLQILGHYFLCIWRSSCLSTMCHRKLSSELLVVAPFDKLKLESQVCLFKTTMIHNAFQKLKKSGKKCNNLKRMWLIISSSTVFTLRIFAYVKLAKLDMCQVSGFVENEHCFNTSPFMQGTLHNCLTTHLDVCLRMSSQDFYNLESFPYTKVIPSWKEKKTCYKINV